jgi:hypothetical protein
MTVVNLTKASLATDDTNAIGLEAQFSEESLRDRDHPLIGSWTLQDRDLLDRLKLPPPKSDKHAAARERILTEAIIMGRRDRDRWTSYSRRREFYAQRDRYFGKPLTYETVVRSVDELAQAGYLDHQKSMPGQRGTQSRYRASDSLMAMAEAPPMAATYAPREIIVLRDHDRNLLDYNETEQTSRMRSRLIEINEAIAGSKIVYGGIAGGEGSVLVLPHGKLTIQNRLHRVFNRGRFSLGGRFYGGTWQNIPKEFRAEIVIDGESTVERDHARLHPTLLYGLIGRKLDFDPYDIPGFDRSLAKTAFNTLVNAETELAALRSIANEIGGQGRYARARELILGLKIRNPAISHLFGSGAGLKLQRTDSDMAESVQRDLLRKAIVGLPIHDSHIVQAKHHGVLVEIMDKALNGALKTIGGKVPISMGCPGNVPQYGDHSPVGPVLPWPFSVVADPFSLVLPDGRVLFGGRVSSGGRVLFGDRVLTSWTCWTLPLSFLADAPLLAVV